MSSPVYSEQSPIVDQLIEANGAAAQAQILLRCPDTVLVRHGAEIREVASPLFQPFLACRIAGLAAVRTQLGALPDEIVIEIQQLQAEVAAFAATALFEDLEA